MAPDFLAILSRHRCPTCNAPLSRPAPHCGEEESHQTTQDRARDMLVGMALADGLPPDHYVLGRLPPVPVPASPEWLGHAMSVTGLSDAGIARVLHLSDDHGARLVRRWCAGDAPIPWAACDWLRCWWNREVPERKDDQRRLGGMGAGSVCRQTAVRLPSD